MMVQLEWWMYRSFWLMWLMVGPPAMASTLVVGGNLGDATWDLGGSPYIVQGDVVVQTGAVLTVEAGVEVRFAPTDGQSSGYDTNNVEFTVEGSLDVQGTAGQPVVFRADASSTKGDWYGIIVDAGALSVSVSHAEIRHARYGVRNDAAAGVLTVDNTRIDTNSSAGIYVLAGNPVVTDSDISDSGSGIWLASSGGIDLSGSVLRDNTSNGLYAVNNAAVSVSLDHVTITENSWGVRIETSGSGTKTYDITNSIVFDNDSYGIYKYGSSTTATLSWSNEWGNGSARYGVTSGSGVASINPLLVGGGDYHLTSNSPSRFASDTDGYIGAFDYDGTATPGLYGTLWTDTTLTEAGSPHIVAGDLTVPEDVSLTVEAGATVEFATSDIMGAGSSITKAELRVEGTLWADGTEQERIHFTSAGSSTGSWYGVHLLPTANASVIDHVDVDEATYAIWSEATADNPITDSTVTKSSSGLYVTAGSPTVDSFEAYGNSNGVHLILGGAVTMTRCLLYDNSSNGLYAVNSAATDVWLNHCTIIDNSWGVRIETSGTGTKTYDLDNSLVANNDNYGIYKYGSSTTATLTSSLIWSNGSSPYGVTDGGSWVEANPLLVGGTDYRLTETSPGRFAAGANKLFDDVGALEYDGQGALGLYGTLWDDKVLTVADSPHSVDGDVVVPTGVTLTVEPGAVVEFGTSDLMKANVSTSRIELIIDGTLVATGTPQTRSPSPRLGPRLGVGTAFTSARGRWRRTSPGWRWTRRPTGCGGRPRSLTASITLTYSETPPGCTSPAATP